MVMTKEQKQGYEDVIINAIKDDDDVPKTNDRQKLLKYADDRFRDEYGHEIKRVGEHQARQKWLSGLAINLPYMGDDIINMAKAQGTLKQNASEKEEDKLLDNYWNFMAMQIHHANKKHKINSSSNQPSEVFDRQMEQEEIIRRVARGKGIDEDKFALFMTERFPPESFWTTEPYAREWAVRIKEGRTYAMDGNSLKVYNKYYNDNSGVNRAVSKRNSLNMSKPVPVKQHTRKNTTGVRKHTRNKAKRY